MILTVRDPYEWAANCRATILSPRLLQPPTLGGFLAHKLNNTSSLRRLNKVMLAKTLGPNAANATDWELAEAFEYWNSRVVSSIPQDKLLVYNPNEGWGPLCEFLDLPEPKVPFPHVNKREDVLTEVLYKQHKRGIIFERRIVYAIVTLAIILMGGIYFGWLLYVLYNGGNQ